jgi:hypothetical protein
MDIDASAKTPREPVASPDTALACLAQLGVKNGFDRALAAVRRGDVLDGDPCPFGGSSSSPAISSFHWRPTMSCS